MPSFFQDIYLIRVIRKAIENNHILYKLALRSGIITPVKRDSSYVCLPDLWKKDQDDRIREAWEITELLIMEIKKEAGQINARLLVFYVPCRVAIYDDEWEDTKKKYGIDDKSWDINRSADLLSGICRKNDVDLIEPTALFRGFAESARSKRLYYIRDSHWTARGHRLVAGILKEYILNKYKYAE